jgi:hypothetical protein
MRRRLQFPVRPFDITPPQMIEAAKRAFTLLRSDGRTRNLSSDQSPSAQTGLPRRGRILTLAGAVIREING